MMDQLQLSPYRRIYTLIFDEWKVEEWPLSYILSYISLLIFTMLHHKHGSYIYLDKLD